MGGESPDWGLVSTVIGAPVLSAQTLGTLAADTWTLLAANVDVAGFAGVDLIMTPSTHDNTAVLLAWSASTPGGSAQSGHEVFTIGRKALFGYSVPSTGRFFTTKGQLLSVYVKGLSAGAYDGILSVLPVTINRTGRPMLRWYEQQLGIDWVPGQVAVIDQACNPGVYTTVPFIVPAWGEARFQYAANVAAGCQLQVQSFSYYNRLVGNQVYTASSIQAAPLNVMLPGSAYNTLAFYNNGGAAVNPFVSVLIDPT